MKINLAIWRKHYNFAVGLHKIWKQNKKTYTLFIIYVQNKHLWRASTL